MHLLWRTLQRAAAGFSRASAGSLGVALRDGHGELKFAAAR